MDLGRPKQTHTIEMPNPSIPALEGVVRSHSAQLTKLHSELSSAFSQVTGEMGEIKTSAAAAAATLSALTNQVTVLTDMMARQRQDTAAEGPPILPPTRPVAPAPVSPANEHREPRTEPILIVPRIYSGEFIKCRGFLGQCQMLFRHQPSRYQSDGDKIALIISALSEKALDWAIATTESNPLLSSNLELFLQEFRSAFDHHPGGADAAGRLHTLSQGSCSVAEYTLEFRTLAADSRWDDAALLSAYRRGLSEEIKDLIVRDRPSSTQDLIDLALTMDSRLHERRRERAQHPRGASGVSGPRTGPRNSSPHAASPAPSLPQPRPPLTRPLGEDEPMQLGRSRLTPEIREQRMRDRLCLYCGKTGHLIRTCPTRPKDPAH